VIRGAILSIALAAMLASATAAAARPTADEPPIGTRLGKRVKGDPIADERKAALAAHEMARCMVNKREGTVRDLLAATSDEQAKKVSNRLMGEMQCFNAMLAVNDLVEGRSVTFPPDVLRGMLAEYLVKKDAARVGLLPRLQPLQQIYVRPWYPATARDPIVDEMATCVAEVNPIGTLAMLGSQPYSGAEGTAMGALAVDFGRCLRAGAKLRANRQGLRAALAEALYQRTQPWPIAQPQPVQPPGTAK
jgi:hypothetical protein